MDRKLYTPTEKQEQKWASMTIPEMPTDDEFKAMWKKSHHGKITGWGLGKRDWILSNMKSTREYQTGLWQGAVDAARGIPYQHDGEPTDENLNCWNLGYYRGYTGYHSNRHGWDADTRAAFDAQYLSE